MLSYEPKNNGSGQKNNGPAKKTTALLVQPSKEGPGGYQLAFCTVPHGADRDLLIPFLG